MLKSRKKIIILSFAILCSFLILIMILIIRNYNVSVMYRNIYPQFSIEEMLGDTPSIITGKVVDIKLYKKTFFNIDIHNDVFFQVDESYHGDLKKGDIIKITYLKSEDKSVDSDDALYFNNNESALLFLNEDINETQCDGKHFIVKGAEQGKFKLQSSGIFQSTSSDPLSININTISQEIIKAKEALALMSLQ